MYQYSKRLIGYVVTVGLPGPFSGLLKYGTLIQLDYRPFPVDHQDKAL